MLSFVDYREDLRDLAYGLNSQGKSWYNNFVLKSDVFESAPLITKWPKDRAIKLDHRSMIAADSKLFEEVYIDTINIKE
jgi:hypothetical protein